jgi:hypothetical protein
MTQEYDKPVSNDKTTGVASYLGSILRNIPGNRVVRLMPSGEPMMKIESGLNEASIPLSLVKRIVEKAPAEAFGCSTDRIVMCGCKLIDVLEDIECEDMPLRTRYAVIESLRVAYAAAVFTFGGDVILEADRETIDLAYKRGSEQNFEYANAALENARLAASLSGRLYSGAEA